MLDKDITYKLQMLHCHGTHPNSCLLMPASESGRRERIFLCGSWSQFILFLLQIIAGIQKNQVMVTPEQTIWEGELRKKKIKDCEIILCVRKISVNETCILQIWGSHIGNAIFLDVSLTAQNEVWVLQLNSFSICLNSPWLPALETDAHPLLIVDYCSHHLGRKAKPHQKNRQTLWLLENTGR